MIAGEQRKRAFTETVGPAVTNVTDHELGFSRGMDRNHDRRAHSLEVGIVVHLLGDPVMAGYDRIHDLVGACAEG